MKFLAAIYGTKGAAAVEPCLLCYSGKAKDEHPTKWRATIHERRTLQVYLYKKVSKNSLKFAFAENER